MATTTNRSYRYPVSTDTPDVPRDIGNLASDVDSDVETHENATTGVHGVGGSTVASAADISTHSGLDTGVHGVGASTVASASDVSSAVSTHASAFNHSFNRRIWYRSSAQTGVADSTWTTIDWNANYSTGELNASSVATESAGVITVGSAGLYAISGQICLDGSPMDMEIWTPTTSRALWYQYMATNQLSNYWNFHLTCYLSASQQLQIAIYQTSGGTRNIGGGSFGTDGTTYATIVYLGA